MDGINLSLEPKIEQNGWAVFTLAGFECNIRASHPSKSGNERSVRLKFEAPEGYGVNIAIQLHGGAGPVPEGAHQLITIHDLITALVTEASFAVEQTFEDKTEKPTKEW